MATTLYTAKATVTGGRVGHGATDDKALDVNLVKPGSSAGTNPEQLFAIGYGDCFGGAVGAVAKHEGVDGEGMEIKSEVTLNQDENGFFIGATLNVTLPKLDADTAVKIVAGAHQMCPYSKATRGNIVVKLTANGKNVG